MAYSAAITRGNPACLIFMVDQSASMGDPIGSVPGTGGPRPKKRDVAADALNEMLFELCIRGAKAGATEDYFEVAVIGYSDVVASAFAGELAGRDLVRISQIAAHPARIEERSEVVNGTSIPRRVPIWIEPTSVGGTRMNLAFQLAAAHVDRFLRLHPDSYPPIVVNLTDGEPTDGDPSELAAAIRDRQSSDGAALLFNLHLGSVDAQPRVFPDDDVVLPDAAARQLFNLSSTLPGPMRSLALASGLTVGDRSRGFAYNADISSVVKFLDIGTRALELR